MIVDLHKLTQKAPLQPLPKKGEARLLKILKEFSYLIDHSNRILIKSENKQMPILKPPLSEGVWGRLLTLCRTNRL